MSDETLAGEIQALLTETLLIEVPSSEADLIENGGLDSVTLGQLIVHLEDRFGIKLDLNALEAENFRSVRAISRLVLNQKPDWGRNQVPREALAGKVQALLTEKLLIDVRSLDTDLFENGGLDPATLGQLILHLEDRFGIKLDLNALAVEDFRSVRSISRLVLNQKPA